MPKPYVQPVFKRALSIGQTVYLRVSPEKAGMIVGIMERPNGLTYHVAWADEPEERVHFEIELTEEKTYDTGEK